MQITETLPAQQVERIWSAAERMLDSDPTANAVLIWQHYNASIGLVPSNMAASVSYVRRAARRKRNDESCIAAYVVTRGRGESYEIEAI